MAKFDVGEIAIMHSLIRSTHLNNTECEIISGPHFRKQVYRGFVRGFFDGAWYVVKNANQSHFPDGGRGVSAKNLRKKRPPQELSSWKAIEELTGWSPLKENTNEPIH